MTDTNTNPAWTEKFLEVLNSIAPDSGYLPIHTFGIEDWYTFESKMYHSSFRNNFFELINFDIAQKAYDAFLESGNQSDLDPIVALCDNNQDWKERKDVVTQFFNRDSNALLASNLPTTIRNFLYYAFNKYDNDFETEHKMTLRTDNVGLYKWLYERAGGKWYTDQGEFYFENLSDMVLCKLLFTEKA